MEYLRSNFLTLEDWESLTVCNALIYSILLIALTFLDTSKAETSGMVYGGRGTFLSSLAGLSFLTITSHHQSYNSLASLCLHHSGSVTRLVPAPAHHQLSNRGHGTRITVQDLFGNIPVRLKQRTIMYSNKGHEKDWQLLSNHIVGVLLAWNKPLVFILCSPGSSRKLSIRLTETPLNISPPIPAFPRPLDLSLVRNVLSQAKYIEPSGWSEWIETSIQTESVAIQGAISLRPAPSKYMQFISIGIRYIHPEAHNIFYDLINQMFAGSNFGKEEVFHKCEENKTNLSANDGRFEQTGGKAKHHPCRGERADKWPMFFICVDLHSQPKQGYRSDSASLEMENTSLNISNALEAMIVKFLSNHHFRARKLRKAKSSLAIGLQNKPLCNVIHSTTVSSLSSMSTKSNILECRQKLLQPSLGTLAALTHEERSAVTPESLGREIRLPSFSHLKYSLRGPPSHWSRIRSGRAGSQLEFVSRPKSESRQHPPFSTQQLIETEPILSTANPNNHVKDTQNGSRVVRKIGGHAASIELAAIDANHDLESLVSTIADHDQATHDAMTLTDPIPKAEILIHKTGLGLSDGPRSDGRSHLQRMPNFDAVAMQEAYSPTTSAPAGAFETSSWVTNFLKTWKNPVFGLSENDGPFLPYGDTSASHTLLGDKRHSDIEMRKFVTGSSALISDTLSRKALGDAQVIAQVEKKFVLIRMRLCPRKEIWENGALVTEQVLVLVDQHAADERVRIERLLSDLCTQPRLRVKMKFPCVHPESRVVTTVLARSIVFEIQEREYAHFTVHAAHFADWGILYSLHLSHAEGAAETPPAYKLAIKTLPEGIAERCRMDAKALIGLMRREVWRRVDNGNEKYNFSETPSTPSRVTDTKLSAELGDDHWHSQIINCPQGILDLLNSRSCRSAIMFNDELTPKECLSLIRRLATCIFPFQCAHGRPSMIPVAKLGSNSAQLDKIGFESIRYQGCGGGRTSEMNFSQAWKRWKKQIPRNKDE